MTWTLTDDVDAFAGAAGGLLGSQPERYTVLTTVLSALAKHGPNVYGAAPPVLGWWSPDGAVSAAVLRTPPHPLLVSSLPADSVAPLVAALAPANASGIGSVIGAEPDAEAFAEAWSAATGQGYAVAMRQRLYRLGELTPPDPMPAGAPRIATPADERIARAMHEAFSAETGQRPGSATVFEARLRAGGVMLWDLQDDPVSVATITEVIGGVARIGQVYTPPEHRNRGYGGAVTAAASTLARDHGASAVVLFTDLANPTSNSIYMKLGYVPVEDKIVLTFTNERAGR